MGAKGAGSGGRIVWNNWKQEISIGATDKPFRIEKRQVYESYKAVKAKLGAAGVDRAGSVCLNSIEQRLHLRCVARVLVGRRMCNDLAAIGIRCHMQLSPTTAGSGAMLLLQPWPAP